MNETSPVMRIWDLPTRIFHWLLAACVIGAIVTANLGGLWMDWHVRFGLATLGLIVFRLAWGCVGPRYARFTQFMRAPRAVVRYLRGEPSAPGHNPLGGWSVAAMLAVLGFQAGSGLFANDDILTEGPLAQYIEENASSMLTGLHQANAWLVYALVGLHLAAIAWYVGWRRKRLVRPMISGDMRRADWPAGAEPARDGPAVWLLAAVIAAAAGTLVWWIQSLAPAAGSFY